jgi:hypothetical protein
MRRLLLSTLFLIPLLSLIPAAQAAEPAEVPPEGFMGMVVRDPHYEWRTNPEYPGANEAFMDAMGRNLQVAGVEWVRIEFRSENKHSDVPGQLRLEQYDYFINTVAPKYGLKVLALLATQLVHTPDGEYINPEEFDTGVRTGDLRYGDNVNNYMRIFFDNAFEIARRYPYDGNRGIAAFEILNEENRYIGGGGRGLEPRNVAELLTKFYRIYRRGGNDVFGPRSTDVKIILGGIHPGRCDDCVTTDGLRMTDRQYLDAIYASTAFTSYKTSNGRFPLDGVGYHPYPAEVASGLVEEHSGFSELPRVPQRMSDIRDVMTRHGDTANKIWVTEIGERGAPRDIENQRRQSEFMKTIYWMLWRQRAFVQNVFWFKYEDFAVPEDANATGPENWGVVRLVPRTPTEQCPDCSYAATGEVQVYKQSFITYSRISRYGEGLVVHSSYMPLVAREQ